MANSPGPAKLRRQVFKLSLQDLLDFPVWEFASDEECIPGKDEATVRPYLTLPVDSADGLLVVRASFTLADGAKFVGYLSPPPPLERTSSLGNLQPVIVTNVGQVPFWFGIICPSSDRLASLLRILEKPASQIFPLTFRSDISVKGGAIEGNVDGFSFLKGGREVVAPVA